jgi:hypothetical protein
VTAIENEILELQKRMNPEELQKEKRARLEEEKKRRDTDKKKFDEVNDLFLASSLLF